MNNVKTVETKSPKMIVADIPPNNGSKMSGNIPKIVVRAANETERIRLTAESMRAMNGFFRNSFISKLISSTSTMIFFIIIPVSETVPTMDMKPKGIPKSNKPGTMPIKAKGKEAKIIKGIFKSAKSNTQIMNMKSPARGT